MDLIERKIQVGWQHRVFFTDRVFHPENLTLRNVLGSDADGGGRQALVVVDAGLARAQAGLVQAIETYFKPGSPGITLAGPPRLCPGGEAVKASWAAVAELHAAIDRHHIDRHSYLIAVGGGALLDMAGLAAATAHRGVRHVRIPTTTLSQCDSGVGVKNGINAFGKKNFIGTFAPPHAVINDFQLLATLGARDWRAGFVEAVKVACIRSREFFAALEADAPALAQFQPAAVRRLIRRCAELHVNHIATSGDPFEFGSARPLDFGHWAAHKLEQMSDFTLRHGEAVAVGIALDVTYARRAGLLGAENAERVLQLLAGLGFALFHPDLQRPELLTGLEEFREHLGGQLMITLLRDVGAGLEVSEMNVDLIRAAIAELAERFTA
ncbi:MAG TPA: 3-dehydroquinate synthase [Verrucomicrobiota bacterium]|nr:3-dehydroquinate synthase [Verrucomicrobiota bacterium]HNT15767.1 3-dehydroquinate synthase [Verrucomicrobiota bacterium]